MILSESIKIKISNNQIKYYKEKGYDIKGGNEIKEIKISDLPKNSGQKIKVKCDFCNNEKYISLNNYNINTKNGILKYACSRKCAEQKNKDTIEKKYGVSNISLSKEIQKKKEDTCKKNHGVVYPMMKEEIFLKGTKTKEKKYGDKNYNNIEKYKQTSLKKYSVNHPMKSPQVVFNFKKKLKEKWLKKIISNEKYLKLNIVDYDGQYIFKCDCNKNHTYKIDYKLLWQRLLLKTTLCTICNPIDKHISGIENKLLNFIKENYDGEIITSNRNIIKPHELDIYLPEINLAFEFNGLYWHNELYKDKNYHLNKSEECEKQGIHLFHIYEDDWLYKNDIIKSMILNKLGKTKTIIYARKTVVKEITDNKLIKDFLDKNHLQGFVGSKIKLGLYHKNELVSLMTFGKKRLIMKSKSKSENEYELLRFCNKLNTNVVGGASKLFKYFMKNYNPNEITTYADRSHSYGQLYETLGFKFIHKTQPNYFYIVNSHKENRFGFRKDVLVKQGYNKNMTEHEIMLSRKIYRIYDSGSLKYIFNML